MIDNEEGNGWLQDAANKAVDGLKQLEKHTIIYSTNEPPLPINGATFRVDWGEGDKTFYAFPEIPMEMTIHITKGGECRSYQVKGIRIGDLIIHPDPTVWGDELIVSHVPTLISFEAAVPNMDATEAQLINWCKLVQQDLRDDWEALHSLTYKTYNGQMPLVKDRIQKHCLSIPLGE